MMSVPWCSVYMLGMFVSFWSLVVLKSPCAGSGVSTDIWTSFAARIMVVSVIPFLIVQFPQILNSTSGRHLAVLISLIVSVLLLISYCLYQVIFFLWRTCISCTLQTTGVSSVSFSLLMVHVIFICYSWQF